MSEARLKITHDIARLDFENDDRRLQDGGFGAQAYADAIATYLSLACNRLMDRQSSLCGWDSGFVKIRNTFARQGFTMTWDFAEGSPFSESSGNFVDAAEWIVKVLSDLVRNCSPPSVVIWLDTVTAGSIHRRVWTAQPFSRSRAMT